MEYILHFLFLLVKVYFLSRVYTAIIYLITPVVFKNRRTYIKKNEKIIKVVISTILALVLFCFSFSFYGNHGLGDFARVPLRNGYQLGEINSEKVFVYKNTSNSWELDKFLVRKDYIYGMLHNQSDKYFIYNLKNGLIYKYENHMEYNRGLIKFDLKEQEYENFAYYYQKYWFGWRFFFSTLSQVNV